MRESEAGKLTPSVPLDKDKCLKRDSALLNWPHLNMKVTGD